MLLEEFGCVCVCVYTTIRRVLGADGNKSFFFSFLSNFNTTLRPCCGNKSTRFVNIRPDLSIIRILWRRTIWLLSWTWKQKKWNQTKLVIRWTRKYKHAIGEPQENVFVRYFSHRLLFDPKKSEIKILSKTGTRKNLTFRKSNYKYIKYRVVVICTYD